MYMYIYIYIYIYIYTLGGVRARAEGEYERAEDDGPHQPTVCCERTRGRRGVLVALRPASLGEDYIIVYYIIL